MKITDTALLALIGVLLTQISLHVVEWTKSRRERKRTQRERELSLKRDTYLPLVNALTEQMTLFLSIPATHHTKLAEWKLSPDSQRALGSIGLIASEQVIDALNQASKQLTRGSMRLVASKMEEVKLVIELEGIESQIKQLNEANTQNANRMKALQDAGKLNQELAISLNSEFERNGAQLQELFALQKIKFEKRFEFVRELQRQSMKEFVELANASFAAFIAIRKDLEMPTDTAALERHMRDSISFIDEVYPGLLDEFWHKAKV